MRYQIVYIGLICILASIALFHLSKGRKAIWLFIVLILYGSLLWHPVRISLVNLFWPGITRVLLGAKPDLPNFYEGYYREVRELYHAFSWIDQNLSKEVKVLFVGERRIYKMPRPFIASSDHDEELLFVLALKEPDSKSIRKTLSSLGITHLLINVPGWSNYLNLKTELSSNQRLNLEDFFNKYVGPIISSPSKAFYIARLTEPGKK